ncbi:sugar transferase [Flavobacteriaceae bacterium D16]|nr:sugar transferase [Flavobacteriaceae bacterium D16]
MYAILKRIFDFLAALLALLLFSPLMIIIIVLLIFVNNGKPFFYQTRVGKNEKLFTIIKFKTMRDPKDKDGEFLNQAERLTKVGSFIRDNSLDELPQLINVLIGQMSIVGPRPLLPLYLPLYNEEQHKRHLAKPGITGWAQVNGRNILSWEEKFEHDVWYVHNISFTTDLKILIKTIQKVLARDGIYTSNEADAWATWKGNS